MTHIEPINQIKLFGLTKYFIELSDLYKTNKLPNKILLSGQKGLGKSTLSYHFINYVLSQNEENSYDLDNFQINQENHSFITLLNRSNPNFILVDISLEKKIIDINQIRNLINNLNKSSFNTKPRFVLIDNIEFLNTSSINALLKVLEEPAFNIHFILINNNKKILSTLLSRCINFNISLSNNESILIANKLLNGKLYDYINKDLINYYMTPGDIYSLAIFGINNEYELANSSLNNFLNTVIKKKDYKKDNSIKSIVLSLIDFYFNKLNLSFSSKVTNKYTYFLKKISDTKKFNLDEESLFTEFKDKMLNE